MGRLALHIDDARQQARDQRGRPGSPQIVSLPGRTRRAEAPRFAPGGQSTQMIVGADAADDRTILATSARLYGGYGLRRVYYSAFSPIPDASRALPLVAPPLVREHRLYQADWLMRFYGFTHDAIGPPAAPGGDASAGAGMLSLEMDPKLAWAVAHPELFPVDLNTAPRERLLRVPGLGVRTVDKLLSARRVRRLRHADLGHLHVPLGKVLPFVMVTDHRPADRLRDTASLLAHLAPQPVQASLFV